MQKDREDPLTAAMSAIRRQAPALIAFSFLANLLLLVSAVYMLQIYNRVLASGSIDTLLWLTVVTVVALAIYGMLEQARRLILSRIGCWLDNELSAPVFRQAIAARLEGAETGSGLRDIADLRAFVAGEGVVAFLDAPWSPVFIVFIWLLHPALGILAVSGAVVLFLAALVNDILTRSRQRGIGADLRRNQAAAYRYIESAETISPLGMVGSALAHWLERRQVAHVEQVRLVETTALIGNISRTIRLGLQVLILGLGAYLVLEGQLTSGAMIAASIILSRALSPVDRSIGAWRGFVSARTAKQNLARALSASKPTGKSVRLPRPLGHLVVQNVRYVVPTSRDPILGDISFELASGQTCVVVGPSGAGKSSLCRVLVGAWKPVHGHVRLDGADVAAWNTEDLGQFVGYLPQQVDLFPGTVGENIARLHDVDSAKVIAAAKLAGVHDMILHLPSGYETDVGLHGSRISLGQRQRIGLARALFDDPPFIVLDEPNLNLDSEGDQALMRALGQLKQQGRTIVVVSHQPAPLRLADKILVLKQGSVAMFGNRDEVLKVIMGARRHIAVVGGAAPGETTGVAASTTSVAE